MRKKENKQDDSIRNDVVLFDNAEEAWFWFILAQQAKLDGARFTAGMSLTPRPCEPSDIFKVLNVLTFYYVYNI